MLTVCELGEDTQVPLSPRMTLLWYPGTALRGRYLTHFKKIVRDRSVFEDNQVDPAALQVCLASMAKEERAEDEEVNRLLVMCEVIPAFVFYCRALPHTWCPVLSFLLIYGRIR